MALLVERLSNKLAKEINSDIIWEKLKTMYNLTALDELEPLHFQQNELEHFALPEIFYLAIKSSTSTEDIIDLEKYDQTNKSETSSNSGTSVSGLKETESRTRNSTPARQLENTGNETSKRTQPKRTRASTTGETPSSSPSTPTPTQTKRRRI